MMLDMTERKYLSIYLQDHLAGATVGVELARRTASANADHPSGAVLHELADEIAEDRRALADLMDQLEIGRDRLKTIAAWVGEKVGRVKLNGELSSYSPLSRLVELEGLALGVDGKLCLWQALDRTLSQGDLPAGVDLPSLIERASSQRRRLEDLRLAAADAALAV